MKLNSNICKNCLHFFQSGLAKYMSDGEAGYCLLIQLNKNTDIKRKYGNVKAKLQAIKSILDSCDKFETKKIL